MLEAAVRHLGERVNALNKAAQLAVDLGVPYVDVEEEIKRQFPPKTLQCLVIYNQYEGGMGLFLFDADREMMRLLEGAQGRVVGSESNEAIEFSERVAKGEFNGNVISVGQHRQGYEIPGDVRLFYIGFHP